MQPLVVVMGISGVGKSAVGHELADRVGVDYADGEDFHSEANIAKMSAGTPLTDEDRWPWLAAIAQWIDERCQAGERGIVSCSALKRTYRSRIVGTKSGVQLVYLKGDITLIGRRLQARKHHFMPASLLESQFTVLEEPQAEERALTVSIAMSPRRVVGTIIERLGLEVPPGGG